jgi:VWFA-related protein
MKFFTILLIIICGYISCISQSFTLFDLDNSKYPLISAKFYATDNTGMPLTGLDINDFKVKEAGNDRKIISVDCPPQNPPQPLSSVLVIDVSGSMSSYRTDITKNAAKVWVNSLYLANSECAITTFDDKCYMMCDFTNNKNKLLTAINNIVANKFGGTNYDQALIGAPAGGLIVAKTGVNKRIVVFLSDGAPGIEPNIDNIISYAKINGIIIYSISIFLPAPESMIRFSNETGGMFFSNLTSEDQLIEAYKKILDTEQGGKPCSITWQSEPYCDAKNITAVVSLLKNNKTSSPVYTVPPGSIPEINLSKQIVSFGQININSTTIEQIDATAQNGDIIIDNIICDNNKFSCNPTKYSLKNGELLKIDINYKATDSLYNVGKISVKTNFCESVFYVIAGNPAQPPPNPTLKLIQPNGFETFAVASDTLITWQGVTPIDTVSLNYSTDSGNSWINITDSAANLKYYWKNIPNTPSDNCLMKVTSREKDVYNNSAEFDGFNDYIQISNSEILNTMNAGNFTVEAWIYIRNFSTSGLHNFPVSDQILEVYNNYIASLSNYGVTIPDPQKIVLNKWIYVAVTYERSLLTAYTYINGVRVGVTKKMTDPILFINPYLLIGYAPWGNSEFANGYIDEFRIWNIRRTDAEILDNYNKKLSIPQTGLILYYDFDEPGTDPVDISGYSNTGVFKNGAKKSLFSPVNAKIPSQNDVSDNLWSIVKPYISSIDIDMGICILGNTKDSLVSMFLRNEGKLDVRIDSIIFEGNFPSEFSFVSGFSTFVLKAGSSQDVEFRFNPLDYGLRDAVIKIVTNDSVYYQNIKGVCNSFVLELTSDLIDFGIVKVGNFKDTTVTATLTNKSNADVTILKTYQSTPNDKDFYTMVGGGSFILKPDESHSMTLRFKPSFEGKTSGRVAFEFDGPGSPIYLQLFGEGIIKNAAIAADDITFQALICENEITDSIQIRNIGKETLHINNYSIDNNNFILLNSLQNIDIFQNSYYTVYINFDPKNSGDINGILTIFCNADPDSVFEVNLTGRKENPDYILSKTNINLGYLCQNESAFFSIDITNTGNLSNKFVLNTSSSLTNDYKNELINSLEYKTINFKYQVNATEGSVNEQIEVVDSICNKKTIINISGIIQNPKLLSNDVTIETIYGSNSSGFVVLNNISDRDITINTMPSITGTELSFENLQLPLIIKAKQSINLTVKYIPYDEKNDEFLITYNFEPCQQTFIGKVYGITTISSALIDVGNYSGISGEIINLNIRVLNPINLEKSGINKIKLSLSFNSTLLFPVQGDIGTTSKELRTIDIEITVIKGIPQPLIVKCIAGLGSDSLTKITVDKVTFDGGYTQLTKNDGLFKLNGICKDGGARLLNPNNRTQITYISPMPASDLLKVYFELRESDYSTIDLISSTGESILFLKQSMNKGIFYYEFDISKLSSGLYYLRLKTKNDIDSRKIIISR